MHAVAVPCRPVGTMSPLPPELLLRIMQQLPLPQRLAGPARVCKAWAAAAVAATTDISINNERWVHPGLGVWLQKHGAGVEQLDVCIGHQSEYGVEVCHFHDGCLYLPTSKLQQLTNLSLKGTALELSPDLALQSCAASSSNVVEALPNLADLHLKECSVSNKADLFQLVGAAGLSSLHLEKRVMESRFTRRDGQIGAALGSCSHTGAMQQPCDPALALPLGLTGYDCTPLFQRVCEHQPAAASEGSGLGPAVRCASRLLATCSHRPYTPWVEIVSPSRPIK